jgi:hypothetical protein
VGFGPAGFGPNGFNVDDSGGAGARDVIDVEATVVDDREDGDEDRATVPRPEGAALASVERYAGSRTAPGRERP